MKAISVNNLKFSFDGKTYAVNDVSFDIESGSYVSIIGHNGSGKSTLAKLLVGLLETNKGSIKLFDTVLNEKTINSLRNRIGVVFQNPDNQFIGATVRDDIAFGLENRCIPHQDMDKLISDFSTKVGMQDYLDKEPSNLSGGQKQRVAIAGVLAMNPDIIIFDEATAMLDPKGKREIRQTILSMRKENPNLTIISITHDIEEANLSDEVIVLNEGKIYLQGSPLEVFSKKEELSNIRLDLPFFNKVMDALQEEGVDVDNVKNINELVDKLCQ